MSGIELNFFGYPTGGLIMILNKVTDRTGKGIYLKIQVKLSDVRKVYGRH